MNGRFAEEITPEEFELFAKRDLESYGEKLVLRVKQFEK